MDLLRRDKVKNLKNESKDAIGIFTRTVSRLASTNQKIDKEEGINEIKTRKLQEERQNLKALKKENEVFISKINELIGNS